MDRRFIDSADYHGVGTEEPIDHTKRDIGLGVGIPAAVLVVTAYLVHRYRARVSAWWEKREEKKEEAKKLKAQQEQARKHARRRAAKAKKEESESTAESSSTSVSSSTASSDASDEDASAKVSDKSSDKESSTLPRAERKRKSVPDISTRVKGTKQEISSSDESERAPRATTTSSSPRGAAPTSGRGPNAASEIQRPLEEVSQTEVSDRELVELMSNDEKSQVSLISFEDEGISVNPTAPAISRSESGASTESATSPGKRGGSPDDSDSTGEGNRGSPAPRP